MYPIDPQPVWHFRQSVDYSVTANYAVLDYASRQRDELLFNIYRMGRNSIEKGSRDNWTTTPSDIAAVERTIAESGGAAQLAGEQTSADETAAGGRGGRGGRARAVGPAGTGAVGNPVAPFGNGTDMKFFNTVLRDPAKRDPRGYIVPSNQPDFPTATKFINTLRHVGVTVMRATSPFTVNGKTYPTGSFVVKTAQAFRPHILDMFEPQDHPNDIPYPGGPPTPPYDNAGWTLAYQMGVQFDRILDPFSGPFTPIVGFAKPPRQHVGPAAAGYALSHSVNDAFAAVNRLLARGEEVYTLLRPISINGRTYDIGTFYIPAKPGTEAILSRLAGERGLTFDPFHTEVSSTSLKRLRPARIALWDQYGGSITGSRCGRTASVRTAAGSPDPRAQSDRTIQLRRRDPKPRHRPILLGQVVYPQTLDAGNLISKFDVLILPDGVTFARPNARSAPRINPDDIPAEYRDRLGNLTVARTIPQLQEFLNAGGTILAIGSATDLGIQLQLPIANALVDSVGRPLPRTRFYVPGSILSMRVDTTAALAQGLRPVTDFYFDNAPAFRLLAAAESRGIKRIAWIDSPAPLRSGWAWGQRYLNGVTEVLQAPVGKGMLLLYGPDPYFRSQPHGTFKLLFNGLLYRNDLGD